MPKYYPINEEAAKRAKDMNSFSDYQPGSATASYRAMVDEAYAAAERQKARVDPMYHDKIDALVDRYARKLAENLNERNVIDARVPSILISGGGNFPVAKKHKQNAARDRNYGEYRDMKADYERQTSDISAVLTRLNAERAELANGVDNEHPALVAFMKYQNIEALNREILVELVDYIKVYENGNISVKFKFADELRKIAEYIEINTTEDTAVAG